MAFLRTEFLFKMLNLHDILKEREIIELTHPITPNMPIWPGGKPFSTETLVDYDQGCKAIAFSQGVGIGTHMDAPAHFIRNGKAISDYSIKEFIAYACVIDVREEVEKNADYQITKENLESWEKTYGAIPENCYFFALTGWSQYWNNETKYLNFDPTGNMHFPGFAKSAAEYLMQRNVKCVGIDTLSIDTGTANTFPAHNVILGAGKLQLENLTNLSHIIGKKAIVFSLPLNIQDAPESPARVIAIISH